MKREEADFIGAMNMCDEISNEAYKKIMCHCEEQEPCEDCVSRTEIKKMVKEMYLEVANMELDVKTISDCISYTSSKCRQVLEDKLNNIKSVTPTQRWISVKERLPETDGDYLLFGKIDDFEDEYYKFIGEFDSVAEKFGICRDCFDPNTLGCLGSEFYEYGEVLAWMPLPDDYKEGVEE